jgi:hypothetical protein
MGDVDDDAELAEFAALLKERNAINARIGAMLGRPAETGDIGEWIASKIFDIELAAAANNTAFDGHFTTGDLVGRTVNVKTYLRQYSTLDVTEHSSLDYYLIFTGPKSNLGSSRGTLRPFCIESVYLFKSADLLTELRATGKVIGIATGINVAWWKAAEIYPLPTNPALMLNDHQRSRLALFRPEN